MKAAFDRLEAVVSKIPMWVYYAIVLAILAAFVVMLIRLEDLHRKSDAARLPKPIPAAVTVHPSPDMTVERIDTTSNGARVVRVRTAEGVVGISTVVKPGDGLTITRPTPAPSPPTPTPSR